MLFLPLGSLRMTRRTCRPTRHHYGVPSGPGQPTPPTSNPVTARHRKRIPGKRIPGKRIPGKRIPGKRIPGKRITRKDIGTSGATPKSNWRFSVVVKPYPNRRCSVAPVPLQRRRRQGQQAQYRASDRPNAPRPRLGRSSLRVPPAHLEHLQALVSGRVEGNDAVLVPRTGTAMRDHMQRSVKPRRGPLVDEWRVMSGIRRNPYWSRRKRSSPSRKTFEDRERDSRVPCGGIDDLCGFAVLNRRNSRKRSFFYVRDAAGLRRPHAIRTFRNP